MKAQILLICFLLLPIGAYVDSSLRATDLKESAHPHPKMISQFAH